MLSRLVSVFQGFNPIWMNSISSLLFIVYISFNTLPGTARLSCSIKNSFIYDNHLQVMLRIMFKPYRWGVRIESGGRACWILLKWEPCCGVRMTWLGKRWVFHPPQIALLELLHPTPGCPRTDGTVASCWEWVQGNRERSRKTEKQREQARRNLREERLGLWYRRWERGAVRHGEHGKLQL